MTDKELISKLQELKKINPQKNWVLLSKNQLFLTNKATAQPTRKARFSSVSQYFDPKKLAYAFAALAVLATGVGFFEFNQVSQSQNNNNVLSSQSKASLLAEATLKSKVEDFKVKSQALADITSSTSEPAVVSSAVKQATEATKSLTETIQKNPSLVKSVALDINNSKSVLNIPGGKEDKDLKASSDNLYKSIDDPLIASLKKATLTPDQKDSLEKIILRLYNQGKYSDALVNILLIGNVNVSPSPSVTVSPSPSVVPSHSPGPSTSPTPTPTASSTPKPSNSPSVSVNASINSK